ncbi:50S ribosomal protein L11 methyltransferase [Prosthecobacter sp.]|uniref:50S ribosomal protein L11 methyltransferase n=1 Tax=Prosthecobacter sp. TaxID=1965333 RepID=UPI0037843451
MFVWTKLTASRSADTWEERFEGTPDATLVTTSFPGRKMVRLELYSEVQAPVKAAQKKYGGTVKKLKTQNWAAHASQTPPPVKVRDRFVICAAKTDADLAKARAKFPGREIIAVPADMAFGTGHHATTATVLRLLVDAAAERQKAGQKWSMADLGCGSGILAIAAEKLGATRIWGCDYDPAAVKISKENAERNDTPRTRFTQVDVLKWEPTQKWDIVAANIFFDVLEAAFPQLVRSVAPGGLLMLSGILKSQAKACLAAGKRAGFVLQKVVTKGKWVTALGTVKA